MVTALVFSVTLAVAVLLSRWTRQGFLSTSVLFLAAGFVSGPGVLGIIRLGPHGPLVHDAALLALFSVLFTDGMALAPTDLRRVWRLPGRALLFGMPITACAIAAFAHVLAGLGWTDSFLIGAVLSPTDPVFAAAISSRSEVPRDLRHLLSVESGLNDGLALPVVVVLLAVGAEQPINAVGLGRDLALGVVFGAVIPFVFLRLQAVLHTASGGSPEPLGVVAVALLLLALSGVTGANAFLAAFVGGISAASTSARAAESFRHFGELAAELLKPTALLTFGALVTPHLLGEVGLGGVAFALATILLARPVGLLLSLHRSALPWRERAVAAWFGPKGFASVVYALMVLESADVAAEKIFGLTVCAVLISIVAHTSTDGPIARWFARDAAGAGAP